jgi:hypothetical protein
MTEKLNVGMQRMFLFRNFTSMVTSGIRMLDIFAALTLSINRSLSMYFAKRNQSAL